MNSIRCVCRVDHVSPRRRRTGGAGAAGVGAVGVGAVGVGERPAQSRSSSMVASAADSAAPVRGTGSELRITAGFHW